MSRWRRAETRFRLASPAQLADVPAAGRVAVILGADVLRYALLPWSPALRSSADWMAFAKHRFAQTYGPVAADWRITLCDTGRRQARIACAADSSLIDSLLARRNVVSIHPSLMTAFNRRRSELSKARSWLVVQESARLTLGLIADGQWRLVRTRQAGAGWRAGLPSLLAREAEASGEPACEGMLLCEEHELAAA